MMGVKSYCWRGYDRFEQDIGSGERRAIARQIGFGASTRRANSRVRRKYRAGTSGCQLISREKEANRLDPRHSSGNNFTLTVVVGAAVLTCQLLEFYLRVASRCATRAMGMMGMFKWLRNPAYFPLRSKKLRACRRHRLIEFDKKRVFCGLEGYCTERSKWMEFSTKAIRSKQMSNNAEKRQGSKATDRRSVSESYRNALQAFIDRRRFTEEADTDTPCSPDKTRADLLTKSNNYKCDNEQKSQELKPVVPGVPHIQASEIFEIGWVAGTEDRYLELIFAEWQNTRVSLKRHVHPECKDAVKADLDVLSEIRHSNVLLLMATTHTDDHGLVSIFESVDCTLYHYIHDQGERMPIQSIANCGGRLSDALRHSHMRGYVHTAITSHCVYLASSGVVKLGGWELGMNINNPKPDREYEERLRTEIFRWQAPELFYSYEPRKESDVYGLTMLIWEMCTMHVPWSGYSKADVERQYLHWKRGVMIDLYDFPPLLNNLLEAGLQLDPNKRTLDMNRMRRFLRRLEMQYEDEEPVYIDQYANNNNETGSTYVVPIKSPMSKSEGTRLTKSVSAKQLHPTKMSEFPAGQYLHAKKSTPKQNGDLKAAAHMELLNLFADMKRSNKDDIQKNTNVLSNVQNNCKISSHPNCNLESSDTFQTEEDHSAEILQPWNSTYRRVQPPQEVLVESRTTSVYSSPLMETTDDESYKDARTNLKQLKKLLANRREHFFCGSDSSQASTDTSPKSADGIFVQAKSKDYEPHKPASHKTSLEPKYSKSPGQYDPFCIKSALHQRRKIPYLHAPDDIKDAVLQPQKLNSDPQSFFETSLWRKEKLICLSKMRKSFADESLQTHSFMQQTNDGTVPIADYSKNQTIETNSEKSDNTYIINKKLEATEIDTTQERLMHTTEITSDSMETCENKSLQVLKDALDRATKIVRSATPNSDESCLSPTFKTYTDFEIENDSQASKSIFENLYNMAANDSEEIRSIEKSAMRDEEFLFNKTVDSTINSNETPKKTENNITINNASRENPTSSYDTTFSRNYICESIAEVSNEFNSSYNEMKSNNSTEMISNKESTSEDKENVSRNLQNTDNTVEKSNRESKVERKEEKKSTASNFNLMFLNDCSKTKNCKSCHQSVLPRRRSLPAALSQLRGINNSANSTIGKLPIRRGDVPDNTVEDLYIDDEFGDNLNVNMILLDEDLSVDEDFLNDISEI